MDILFGSVRSAGTSSAGIAPKPLRGVRHVELLRNRWTINTGLLVRMGENMGWENEKNKQVRDNKGRLIGYIEEINGVKYVRDQHGTIGWCKSQDKSGPGYSFMSHEGRVAHTSSPEYMLGLKKQKEEEARKTRENQKKVDREKKRKGPDSDGSDPKYKKKP